MLDKESQELINELEELFDVQIEEDGLVLPDTTKQTGWDTYE